MVKRSNKSKTNSMFPGESFPATALQTDDTLKINHIISLEEPEMVMKKSDIIFWSTTFFAYSWIIGFTLGIRQMFLCWGIFLVMYFLFKFTLLYKEILRNLFD